MPSVLGEHAIGRHTRRADPTCPRCHPDQPELRAGFGMPVDDSPPPARKSDPSPGGPTPRRSKAPAPSLKAAVEPVTDKHQKQTTRMRKVTCAKCGCIVRMTRKWLDDAGTPVCGCGGRMAEEAA